MGTTTFVEDFKEDLQFVAVKGKPNLFLIHTRLPKDDAPDEKMTEKDWNEFERHIADAFEQVP